MFLDLVTKPRQIKKILTGSNNKLDQILIFDFTIVFLVRITYLDNVLVILCSCPVQHGLVIFVLNIYIGPISQQNLYRFGVTLHSGK